MFVKLSFYIDLIYKNNLEILPFCSGRDPNDHVKGRQMHSACGHTHLLVEQ